MSAALFVVTATATAAPRLFVAGCGYVGLHVANEARSRGYEVSGSVRNAEKAENLRAAGFDAHVFDLDDGYTGLDDRGLAALASATHVLATVPLLVFANKSDLLQAKSADEIAEALSLFNIKDRPWQIQACSAKTGNGLEPGLKWVVKQVK